MTIKDWQKEYENEIVNAAIKYADGLYVALVFTKANEFKVFTSESLSEVAEFCNRYIPPSAYMHYAANKYDLTADSDFNIAVHDAFISASCEATEYGNDKNKFVICQIFNPEGEELLHFTDELDICVLDKTILPVLREHFPIVAMAANIN